jgi:hypothetical protein
MNGPVGFLSHSDDEKATLQVAIEICEHIQGLCVMCHV